MLYVQDKVKNYVEESQWKTVRRTEVRIRNLTAVGSEVKTITLICNNRPSSSHDYCRCHIPDREAV